MRSYLCVEGRFRCPTYLILASSPEHRTGWPLPTSYSGPGINSSVSSGTHRAHIKTIHYSQFDSSSYGTPGKVTTTYHFNARTRDPAPISHRFFARDTASIQEDARSASISRPDG